MFVWTLLWSAVVTPPLALGLLVHNLFRPTARTFNRWMRPWARAILFGAGIRLRTEVRTALPEEQPVVLVANHQNMLDIVTCSAAIPHAYGFAAKASLRRVPVVGTVLERTACLFVDRSTARRAVESVKEAAVLIREGHSVLIFVEGERTYSAQLFPFLRGAFVLAVTAGVPLVPVVQINNYALFDERRRIAQAGIAHVVVGEPIPTAGVSRVEIPVLMEAVRSAMQRELDRYHDSRVGTPDTASVSSNFPSPPGPE
jgi:1-acyl-sn-glycerol-3-phosphate acyltransferase